MHEKARKEDEKAREKAQKEVEKMAEEAAKAAEEAAKDAAKAAEEAAKDAAKAAEEEAKDAAKAAEDAAKAAEKENADVPVDVPGEDEPETIEQDTTITTPNVEKPDETTNALLVDDEAVIMAPAVNTDGQDVAANEETPAAAAKNEKDEEEPEAAGTDGPFVVVVPPTSVKEDLGDDNKAVLPPPTEDNTIFDITTENEGTTTTTTPILENEGSGISSSSSQNNKPTVADVSTNNGDGVPGPVNTDTDSGLTFSSSISGSSSPDDDGLQPVGKALLSVALAGVFVAFVAVFLLRRQRRSSSSDPAKNALAITPYSPSKDDSYLIDRDESYDKSKSFRLTPLPVLLPKHPKRSPQLTTTRMPTTMVMPPMERVLKRRVVNLLRSVFLRMHPISCPCCPANLTSPLAASPQCLRSLPTIRLLCRCPLIYAWLLLHLLVRRRERRARRISPATIRPANLCESIRWMM